MSNSPELRFHYVSEEEAATLFETHNMEDRLALCSVENSVANSDPMHRTFCCSITVLEYFDPSTNAEVALIHLQTFVDVNRPSRKTIRRFRVGLDVYITDPPNI